MVIATAISSWLGYRGVQAALQSDFERRLERMAAAQQITAEEIRDIQRLHEDSNRYGDVEAQLNTLRAASGVERASLIDSAGQSFRLFASPFIRTPRLRTIAAEILTRAARVAGIAPTRPSTVAQDSGRT